MIDVATARETFEASADFTVGIEEEFALVDPETLLLAPRFELLRDAAATDAVLSESIAGELISSEIEIRSGRRRRRPRRGGAPARGAAARLFTLARAHGVALGRHRHAPAQRLPRAAHHRHGALPPRRGRPEVRRLAQQHVLRPRPRRRPAAPTGPSASATACARCLPLLLAVSANSPYIDGRDSGLHSGRSQTFTKSFPRCGIPDAFGSWQAWAEYVELLVRTNSIVEFTQLWWSVRPHHDFGTRRGADLRRADDRARERRADRADRRLRAPRHRRGRRRRRRRPTSRTG